MNIYDTFSFGDRTYYFPIISALLDSRKWERRGNHMQQSVWKAGFKPQSLQYVSALIHGTLSTGTPLPLAIFKLL